MNDCESEDQEDGLAVLKAGCRLDTSFPLNAFVFRTHADINQFHILQ